MGIAYRSKTYDMVYIAIFAILIAICSWISIPTAVPFSLQTFGVFTAVGVLGGKRGTLAVLVYLILGIIGIPVFTGFSSGIGYLAGTTGGYIIGFVFSALIMWAVEIIFGKKPVILILSMVLGLLVCYAFGTFWFLTVYGSTTEEISLLAVLTWCVFPFVIPDGIKIALAYGISRQVKRYVF